MHQVGTRVARLQPLHRGPGIGLPGQNRDFAGRQRAKQIQNGGLIGQCGRFLPLRGGGQGAHRLDRLPFLLGNDSEVASVAHHLDDARHSLDRAGIECQQLRPHAGLADRAGVQHSRKADVLDEGGAAGDFRRDVDARHRRADQMIRSRVLQRTGGRGLHVQVQLRRQRTVADAAAIRGAYRSVGRGQRFGRDTEFDGGRIPQQTPDLGRRVQDRGAAVLHGVAAGGEALVRCADGIGGNQFDLGRRDIQLFSRHLQQGGGKPLPQFGLAGEHRHPAVRRDANPRVQRRRRPSGFPAAMVPAPATKRQRPGRHRPPAGFGVRERRS